MNQTIIWQQQAEPIKGVLTGTLTFDCQARRPGGRKAEGRCVSADVGVERGLSVTCTWQTFAWISSIDAASSRGPERTDIAPSYEATDSDEASPSIGVTGVSPSIGVTGVVWESAELTVVERERVPSSKVPWSEEEEAEWRFRRLVEDRRARLRGSPRENLLSLSPVVGPSSQVLSVCHRENLSLVGEPKRSPSSIGLLLGLLGLSSSMARLCRATTCS